MSLLPEDKHLDADEYRVCLNVGAGIDLFTGSFVEAHDGGWIINGGLGFLTAISGDGNVCKSLFANYLTASACEKYYVTTHHARIRTYDTECNGDLSRKEHVLKRFKYLGKVKGFVGNNWKVTDEARENADVFWQTEKDYLAEKEKLAKKNMISTPFRKRDGTQMFIYMPTQAEIDSLSKLTGSGAMDISDDNELSDGKHYYLHNGLTKARLLEELPRTTTGYYHYVILTTHLGQINEIKSGPPNNIPPRKALQHMRSGVKAKGVAGNFYYLTNTYFENTCAKPLLHPKLKTPYYPRDEVDATRVDDVDLTLVTIKIIRTKGFVSGTQHDLIFSQRDGLLAELTEFYIINSVHERQEDPGFGLIGSHGAYRVALYPDVVLNRNTVRSKLENDPALARAVNITSQLCQLYEHHPSMHDLLMKPQELYTKIKDLGYDWDFILNQTRGYYCLDDHKHPLKRLSTYDLIRMAHGLYIPFWMKDPPKAALELYKEIHDIDWKPRT